MPPLAGKTVVVTGGSRGIGYGLVQKLLARKNTVVATTRVPAEAHALKELASQHPSGALSITALDTTKPDSISQWAQDLKASGPQHVDVLINNAGIYGRRLGFTDLEPQDFTDTFNTNALGPFLVTQQLYKQGLIGKPGTLIVNVSSIVGSCSEPIVSAKTKGGYAYRASKAALNIMTKALTVDLEEDGVQAVLIHPGYVKTDLTGGNGWIDVETSTSGIMAVLEGDKPLNGNFYAYDGTEIPW